MLKDKRYREKNNSMICALYFPGFKLEKNIISKKVRYCKRNDIKVSNFLDSKITKKYLVYLFIHSILAKTRRVAVGLAICLVFILAVLTVFCRIILDTFKTSQLERARFYLLETKRVRFVQKCKNSSNRN